MLLKVQHPVGEDVGLSFWFGLRLIMITATHHEFILIEEVVCLYRKPPLVSIKTKGGHVRIWRKENKLALGGLLI